MQIAEPLAEALAKKGYESLTPVQEAVLDPDIVDRDLLVSAQTGSGKTVAFGLALAPSLLKGELRLPQADAPLALIIAPTRELALQVTKELEWLYAPAGGKIAACIGGMDMRDERRALSRGVHIVVGTPGRLVDHIQRRSLVMDQLQAIVLDEADEMLNMGFREELQEILQAAPDDRRTLMFSATVSRPIANLAENYQNDALRLNTVSTRQQHVDIEYQAVTVVPGDVEKAVINLLLYHDAPTTIVFCARREGVNRLTTRLTNRGFSVVALSGEFSQKERSNSLLAMRDGRARVCVATDVAARGIDLPGLDLVIHADLPSNKEGLLHRSGRTGRAGRKGISALVVPVRARRRTERLLNDAGVSATFGPPPSVHDIQAAMDARLLANPVLSETIGEGEQDLADALLEKYPPEQLAAAIIRMMRSKQSSPEDLAEVSEDTGRRDRKDRNDRPPRGEKFERQERPKRERGDGKSDFEDGAWITLSVGRRTKADPKWLVPMLCKSGGFSRSEIGVIHIGQTVTHVELKPQAATQLMENAGDAKVIDKSIDVDRGSAPQEAAVPYERPERSERPQRSGRKPAQGRGPRPDARSGRSDARGPRKDWSPDDRAPKRRDRDGDGDDDFKARAPKRPKPPIRKQADGDSEGKPARKRSSSETPFKPAKRKPGGPKKPRGPNGEKKRSPNKPPRPRKD